MLSVISRCLCHLKSYSLNFSVLNPLTTEWALRAQTILLGQWGTPWTGKG